MSPRLLMTVVIVVLAGCGGKRQQFQTGPSRTLAVDNTRSSARSIGPVAASNYPPPGQCRVWYLGRAAGQQPKAAACETLLGRVPRGTFVMYESKAYDTAYDWRSHSQNHPGTVPEIVLQIMDSIVK
jgi:hypothetical protein